MKYILLFITIFIGGLSQATAQEAKTEEQCKIFVDKTVQSLAEQSKKYGETAKLDDLSEDNIIDIQIKKGSCIAMNEINIRINPK